MKNTKMGFLAAALALPLALSACGGSTTSEGSSSAAAAGGSAAASAAGSAAAPAGDISGEIQYWLWDSNQQPAYTQCAKDFMAANPNVTVKIQQYGWDDYWEKIRTGMVAGTAPDVFTDHLAFFPEFVANEQLLGYNDLIARDSVDTGIYQEGLAELWKDQNGQTYGLPKDFDTIALFYNKKMADEAGVTADQLGSLTWNPTDGGTFEKTIAHLTVDKNGKRGDEAGFDKDNVAVYGLWMEGSGGGDGQTQWSMYTGSNGWKSTDAQTWGTSYNYDKPEFQDTITWWKSLADKGYMPSFEKQAGVSWNDALAAGKVASATNGSWMIGSVFGAKSDKFEPAVAPTPVGPSGQRASMFNGLADSIYVGTKNPDAAWAWVKYLGSAACQDVVGKAGVVFPAIPSGTDLAQAAFLAKGADVEPFLTHVKEGTTFLFPITDHKSEVGAIMTPAMEAVMSGKAEVSSLTEANTQVNALFE